MSNLTLLDVIVDNNPLPTHGWELVGLIFLVLALIFAAFWIVRRVLLGRERARKLDEQRRDDRDGGAL